MQKVREVTKRHRERKRAGEGFYIDATVTHRMIRAMMAQGWTYRDIGQRLGGKSPQAVCNVMRSTRVTPGTQQAYEALYGAMQTLPGPSRITRDRAKKGKWAPALAWDDITDPEATPNAGPRRRRLTTKETLYEYQLIRDSGMSHEYALKELGISHDTWSTAKWRASKES